LALLGISIDTFAPRGRRIIPMLIYITMGWLALVAVKPLLHALSPAGFTWLLVGGLFYTGGIVFYAMDKKVRYFHGIWHLFVLAGSASHYLTVLYFVA
jgi:hemolysin III